MLRKLSTTLPAIPACILFSAYAQDAGYVAQPGVVPSEEAAAEILKQTSTRSALRVGGFDLFPHAMALAMYDDNVLISHRNGISDLQWTFAPGLTIAGGDVTSYVPGSVTMDMLRNYLNLPLVDVTSKPKRFVAVDYTPGFNIFTDHGEHNNVDHSARLSGAYTLSRFAVELDQDYIRQDVKSSDVGGRITAASYDTRLRTRYEFSDQTSMEVNGGFTKLEYLSVNFQGYDEFRNDDWINRRIGDKLTVSGGVGLGLVMPDKSADQTYEQIMMRANYLLSGKLSLRPQVGFEVRQYDNDEPTSYLPVFSLATIFLASPSTSLQLEAHHREQPSRYVDYNYATLGFTASVRQFLFNRFYAQVTFGYDNLEYRSLGRRNAINRSDDLFMGRFAIDYELNPRWVTSFFYSYRRDDSTLNDLSYVNNLVGFQVDWRF